MSIYVENEIRPPGGEIFQVLVHPKMSYIAALSKAGSSGGRLTIHTLQGDMIPECGTAKATAIPTVLQWHPSKPLCCVGWASSEVEIWNQNDRQLHVLPKVHKFPITSVNWSGHGNRILTTDRHGTVFVWKLDVKGRPLQNQPSNEGQLEIEVTCTLLMSTPLKDKNALDISALAKAAVSGDEKALDLLSWKGRGMKFTGASSDEAMAFFMGLRNGSIHFLNPEGEINQIAKTDGAIVQMLFHEKLKRLAAVTDNGFLCHMKIHDDGIATDVFNVKLANRCSAPRITLAGDSCLAMALHEGCVRLWDMAADDNYSLHLQENMGFNTNTKFLSIAYCSNKRVLAAGTSVGQLVTWQWDPSQALTAQALILGQANSHQEGAVSNQEPGSELTDAWQLQPPSNLEGGLHNLCWGSESDILVASCSPSNSKAYALHAQRLNASYAPAGNIAITQTGPYNLALARYSAQQFQEHHLKDPIRNMATSGELLAIWSGKLVSVFEFSDEVNAPLKNIGSFTSYSSVLLAHEQNIYTTEPLKIQVRNSKGTVKQLLSLNEMEGNANLVSICGKFMVCATEKNYIRVYDLSRREAKEHVAPKHMGEYLPGLKRIHSVACNCDGSAVSLVVSLSSLPMAPGGGSGDSQQYSGIGNSTSMPNEEGVDCRLYVWEVETDTMQFFNFASGLGEQQEYTFMSRNNTNVAGGKTSGGGGGKHSARNVPDWLKTDSRSKSAKSQQPQANNSEEVNGPDTQPTLEYLDSTEAAKEISGRYPAQHIWDCGDPRLLVVEARRCLPASVPGPSKYQSPYAHHFHGSAGMLYSPYGASVSAVNQVPCMVVSLLLTQENGLLMQDNFPMHTNHRALLAVDVPYFYFVLRPDVANRELHPEMGGDNATVKAVGGSTETPVSTGSSSRHVSRRVMRDFVGLEESTDKASREAMLNFSYFLTLGNMDEAYRAMKLIKSGSVWHNMARMCVKTRRLDVAMVCLGKMGDARGAMLLREAMRKEPEVNAQVAVLAIHLGMVEEAERLLRHCQRYDILNSLYQSLGYWIKAQEIAETFDRIHLRTTYYNYAKYLETRGDVIGAINNYIKSGTFQFEIPRLLFDNLAELEKFIREHPDKSLFKWWAQYMESIGEMQTAVKFYEAAQDNFSLVRVYCYLGQEEKAADICNETGDRAASYHLARQLENSGNVEKAIHFFTRAGAYASAIRLAKDQGRDDHLVNLALLGKPEVMLEAAQYLEHCQGYEDKAVMLYHRAGFLSRAVDLAFRSRQFGALQEVSRDLTENTDPQLMRQCAEFFLQNQQYDRAVGLMATSKQYWEAVRLCAEYHVPITEELAERLTPPKAPSAEGDQDNQAGSRGGGLSLKESERNRLMESIAEAALAQGQYYIACKKFTQAGNPVAGMKALLKSGDTEKVIFFANVSKRKEIYLMAANYLQSVDWRKDAEIMRHIILFYTKARALEQLSFFYEACAQVEVDEYRNYDKAIGALSEAYKSLCKASPSDESQFEIRLNKLKERIMIMKRFLSARVLLPENSDEGMRQLQKLLDEPQLNETVRLGDVYASMVEHFVNTDKMKAAYACLEEMRRRLQGRSSVNMFLDARTLERVHQAMGVPVPKEASVSSSMMMRASRASAPANDEVGEVVDIAEPAIDEDF